MTIPEYTYSPLSTNTSIRALVLEPAAGHFDLLVAGLATIALDSQQHEDGSHCEADFEAVSYSWGEDRAPTKELILETSGQSTMIKIRENVDTMLRYLRFPNKQRHLWIDALCINQDDSKEKSAQVQFMGEIYRRAKEVVIWVGVSNFNAFDDPRRLFLELHRYKDSHTDDMREALWSKLRIFLERTWFRRRWVIQEALLAQRPILLCGHNAIDFTHFARSTWKIAQHQHRFKSYIWGVVRKLWTIYKLRAAEVRPEVLNLLVEFSTAECKDDRDRLYALNALTETRVTVSYGDTVEKVYRDYAAFHIGSGSLAILACSGAFRNEDTTLPSWIPDWRVTPRYRPISTRSTPRQTYKKTLTQIAATAQIVDSGRGLRLMCTKLGYVKQVATPASYPVWDSQLLDIMLDWFTLLSSSNTRSLIHRHTKVTEANTFLATLSLGTISKRSNVLSPDHPWNQDDYAEQSPDVSAILARLIHESRKDDLHKVYTSSNIPPGFNDALKNLTYGASGSHFDVRFDTTSILMTDDHPLANEGPTARSITPTETIEVLCRTIAGRTCFWTKDGVFGMGPGEMSAGDVIVSIPGCSTAYVLRSVNEERGVRSWAFGRKGRNADGDGDAKRYTVVGDCYIHSYDAEEHCGDEESLREYYII